MYVVPKNGWYVKLTSNSCVLYVWRYVVNSLFDPIFQMSNIGTINMSFMHSTSVHTCTVFVPSVSMCVYVCPMLNGPLQQQLHPLWATLKNGHFSVNCILLVY